MKRIFAIWRRRARNSTFAGLATLAIGATVAGAQETKTPEAVSPQLCVITPLTESALVEIVAAGTPVTDGEPPREASGRQVDAESIEAIEGTVRESVACANANDPLRAYALFTDRYLSERFGGVNQDDLGHLLATLTRESSVAEEADRLTLVSIDELRLLEDGRIAADVVTKNARTTFVDTLVFEKVGERWLIDEITIGDPPLSATPAE